MLHKNGIRINPVLKSVSHRGNTVVFEQRRGRSIRFDAACRLILGEPATLKELFETLFDDAEDGGPIGGIAAAGVIAAHLKKRLAKIDLKVHTNLHAGGTTFDTCYVRKWIGP